MRDLKIELNITLFLLIATLFTSDLIGYGISKAVSTTAMLMGLYFCVLLHELGHCFAGRYYGFNTRKVTLFMFGGFAEIENMDRMGPWESIVVSIAGPLVSLLLALTFFAVLHLEFVHEIEMSETILTLCALNAVLFVFNLLPAMPMDGGRALHAILFKLYGLTMADKIVTATTVMLCAGGLVYAIKNLDIWVGLVCLIVWYMSNQQMMVIHYGNPHLRSQPT